METVSEQPRSGPGIPHRRKARRLDRDEARLSRPLPALRPGQTVPRLPEGRDHCSVCGLDFTPHRADDLPAYLVIVIVGHIVVPTALSIETDIRRRCGCNLRSICR
jgi:hypothetical protein